MLSSLSFNELGRTHLCLFIDKGRATKDGNSHWVICVCVYIERRGKWEQVNLGGKSNKKDMQSYLEEALIFMVWSNEIVK